MTPDDFRRIALSMPEAVEVYRRGRSEFRVERRMFAALEGPADSVALLNLSAEQQLTFLQVAPEAFVAALGGWGPLGNTTMVLAWLKRRPWPYPGPWRRHGRFSRKWRAVRR